MLYSVKKLDRELRGYDSALYAQETVLGRYDVYRRSREDDAPPHFLFSLTVDWKPSGKPVPWGLDIVMNRVRAHDLWNHGENFIDRWLKDQEKVQESKDRAFRNSVESFLYDFRSQFHKATNEINTSTLSKTRPLGL